MATFYLLCQLTGVTGVTNVLALAYEPDPASNSGPCVEGRPGKRSPTLELLSRRHIP
jgi:hypothetical protein